jgi:hypothetical protein
LLDPLELHLKEVALELLVNVVMFELAVHPDIAMETPVPVLADRLIQGQIGHRRPLEELQEPVGRGHDHVVVVTVIIGCCIDLLNPGDIVGPMLLREPCNAAIRELLDPVSGLPHPILYRDGKARASSIVVEYVSFWTFFSGESSVVIHKAHPKEFEFFPLSVILPGPLFTVLSMFVFMLLEGSDEATGNIGDGVEVVSDLDSGCSCVG